MNKGNLIYVIIPLVLVVGIIGWLYYLAYLQEVCEKSLATSGVVVMMFAESSEQMISVDNGATVCTRFSAQIEGEKIETETHAFDKIVPLGMPINVLYSFECDDCAKIIFDSVVHYNGFSYRNQRVNEYAYDYIIRKKP